MKALICLLLFFGPAEAAPSFRSDTKLELIRAIQTALLNDNFPQARLLSDSLEKNDPADPAGLLFRAAALQAEMTDAEDDLYGDTFLTLLDSVKAISDRSLRHCSRSDSALIFLYRGHQYAYRALYESRFGSNLSALKSGLNARNDYRCGLKTDSTLYDLYLGLGSYHYWKSERAGLLRTFGFFKDDRERGLREIERAIDRALFSRDAARAALIWIWINEKQYDTAIALCRDMLGKFPGRRTFLWPLAESHFKSGRFDSAAVVYTAILEMLKKSPGNYFNIIELSYHLGRCCEKTGNTAARKELLTYFNSIFDNIPRAIRQKQKSRLAWLKRQK